MQVGGGGEAAREPLEDALEAGFGVAHGQGVGDVAEGAVEEPEAAVDRTTVDHLDHQLRVVGAEEPEDSGTVGEG